MATAKKWLLWVVTVLPGDLFKPRLDLVDLWYSSTLHPFLVDGRYGGIIQRVVVCSEIKDTGTAIFVREDLPGDLEQYIYPFQITRLDLVHFPLQQPYCRNVKLPKL